MDETPCTASPQAEAGHIDIAHELAEAFYKLQLSGYQWRLLWAILRQTYGWHKTQDRISLTFFEKRTGIDKRNAAQALKDLFNRHIIFKNNNGFIVSYGLQKDYTKWILKPVLKSTTRCNKLVLNQDDTSKPVLISTSLKSTPKPVLKSTPTKETKETIIKGIFFKISELEKRYSEPETINQAFQAISSTRKSNKIAHTVKLSILQAWERYPVDQVMAGIKTFLGKDCHHQGKKEAYLLGIIRNNGNGQPQEGNNTGGQVMKSTGNSPYVLESEKWTIHLLQNRTILFALDRPGEIS